MRNPHTDTNCVETISAKVAGYNMPMEVRGPLCYPFPSPGPPLSYYAGQQVVFGEGPEKAWLTLRTALLPILMHTKINVLPSFQADDRRFVIGRAAGEMGESGQTCISYVRDVLYNSWEYVRVGTTGLGQQHIKAGGGAAGSPRYSPLFRRRL